MLRETLSKFYTQYVDLLKFESIKQFDTHYLTWWGNSNNEREIYDDEGHLVNVIEATNRSKIKDGKHLDPKDEKDRLAWLKSTLQISVLAQNIASPILAKENSFDIQKAMFKRCMFEFDELYNQINGKPFLGKKYPFILQELNKLRESVLNKCGYLAESFNNEVKPNTTIVPNKIKWNGNVAPLADLCRRLLFDKKLRLGRTYINEEHEDDMIDLIVENFITEDGKTINRDTLRRYIRSKKTVKKDIVDIDKLATE